MSLECLENIIGVTETDCECLTTKLGDKKVNNVPWYKISRSGLFLDRLPGIIGIKGSDAATPCDDELAVFYETAIKDAVKCMHNDLVTGLLRKFRQIKLAYSGQALSTSYQVNHPLSGNYAGVCIRTAGMKGGSLNINVIYAMFEQTVEEFTIKVYRAFRGSDALEHLDDIAVSTLANAIKPTVLSEPKSYPLCEQGYDYYFLYEAPEFSPKDNTIACGCGSSEAHLNEYAQFNGVEGDISSPHAFATDSYGKGLAFDLSIGCDTGAVVCDLYRRFQDFNIVMSHAARFKAGEIVQELVLNSDDINRYTMMNREYLWGKRNHFRAEYNDRIEWMIETADLSNYDCFICNGNTRNVHKGGILA